MTTRPIRFRVECNKAKSSFWYTLVAGNGNTVMTSKAKYADRGNAKRAANRMIDSLLGAQLVLEYEESEGEWVQEAVEMVVASGPVAPGRAAVQTKTVQPPSFAPLLGTMNPDPAMEKKPKAIRYR